MSLTYYEILNLDKNASADEIKKSYRKMAKECHPDRFQNNKEKEEEFKTINEAYETLSDPNLKFAYDSKSERENLDENRNVFFTQAGSFQDMFNMMAKSMPKKGTDSVRDVNVKFSRMYSKRYIKLKINSAEFKLDLAIKNKQHVVPGLGNKEDWATFPGNLIINVIITDIYRFRQLNNYDLIYSKNIDMSDFLNGISFTIKMPDNSSILIKHDFLNEPLELKAVPNVGMPIDEDGSQRGTLYIKYTVIGKF